jgi:hypothetical protein
MAVPYGKRFPIEFDELFPRVRTSSARSLR